MATVVLLACLVVLLTGTGVSLREGSLLPPATHALASSRARTSARTGAAAGSAGNGVTSLSSGAVPLPSAGCGSSIQLMRMGTTARFQLPFGSMSRSFSVHLAPSYVPTTPEPLVLSFHGTGSSASVQERATGFSRLADQQHFIVVYPQGTLGSNEKTGWASGGPGHPTINDVRFVTNLLTYLQAHLCIDTRRVYATGFSNGAGMTSLLACRLAQRITAFAMVSGSYYSYSGGCLPGRPVPVLEIHGTGDGIVPYAGRAVTHLLPVTAWLGAWAARDGCASAPQTQSASANIVQLTWTRCRDDVSVVHYRILGGVHVWPAAVGCGSWLSLPMSCPADRTFPATAIIWQFLDQYRLPLAPSPRPALSVTPSLIPSPTDTDSVSSLDLSRLRAGKRMQSISGGRLGL